MGVLVNERGRSMVDQRVGFGCDHESCTRARRAASDVAEERRDYEGSFDAKLYEQIRNEAAA